SHAVVRHGDLADGAASDAGAPAFECPRCGAVSDTAATQCGCGRRAILAALPKRLAGKFDVLRRVGAGGMGIVYIGSDRLIGRSVALKTLYVASPDRTGAVLREAQAMATASHEGLAQIHS